MRLVLCATAIVVGACAHAPPRAEPRDRPGTLTIVVADGYDGAALIVDGGAPRAIHPGRTIVSGVADGSHEVTVGGATAWILMARDCDVTVKIVGGARLEPSSTCTMVLDGTVRLLPPLAPLPADAPHDVALAWMDVCEDRGERANAVLLHAMMAARQERDIIKLNGLNDKHVQLGAARDALRTHTAAARAAVAPDAWQHERDVAVVACQRFDLLLEEARNVVGEDRYDFEDEAAL